jgi:hypothetical protein
LVLADGHRTVSHQNTEKKCDGEEFKKVFRESHVPEPVEMVKTNAEKKAERKGGDEYIAISKERADGNDVEVRKQGDKEEKEGKENNLCFFQRPETQSEKQGDGSDESERPKPPNRMGNRKGVCGRIVNREEEKFNIIKKDIKAGEEVI